MTIAKQRLVQEGWSIAYCYQYVAQNGQRYDIWFVSAWEKLKNWMQSFEAIVAFLMDVLNMDDIRYLSNKCINCIFVWYDVFAVSHVYSTIYRSNKFGWTDDIIIQHHHVFKFTFYLTVWNFYPM